MNQPSRVLDSRLRVRQTVATPDQEVCVLSTIKAIACAAATALAVLVFTFGFAPSASAQSTDYTPSSVGAGNLGQGGNVGAGGTARTGTSSTIPLTTLGVGLVSVGGLAIALARRRRLAAAAA